jgi:hypothetical protein
MDANHIVITKMFEKEIKFLQKGSAKRQLVKKRAIVSGGSISKFFFVKDSFKREDVP